MLPFLHRYADYDYHLVSSNYADVGVSPILVWSPIHNYAFKCLINYAKIVTFKTDLLVSLFIYTLKIYIIITRHHVFRSKHLISGSKINISLMFFISWFRIQFQRHIFFFSIIIPRADTKISSIIPIIRDLSLFGMQYSSWHSYIRDCNRVKQIGFDIWYFFLLK